MHNDLVRVQLSKQAFANLTADYVERNTFERTPHRIQFCYEELAIYWLEGWRKTHSGKNGEVSERVNVGPVVFFK